MSIDNPRLTVDAATGSERAGVDALDHIPEQFYWIIGKGRLRTDEPLYGIQIKEPATGEIVAEAEHDDLASAIDLACSEIAATAPAATHGKPDGAVRELEPWQFELDEVIGHLGAAIHQSVASDDQIIMDHVKAAHEIAKIVRRKA